MAFVDDTPQMAMLATRISSVVLPWLCWALDLIVNPKECADRLVTHRQVSVACAPPELVAGACWFLCVFWLLREAMPARAGALCLVRT